MNLKPAPGTIFIQPVDLIPPSKTEVGFSGKTDKQKPEQPYKFRVLAVGSKQAHQGLWVESPVEPGDIISHVSTNAKWREIAETSGFLVDGELCMPIEFGDILGIWETDEERQQKINQKLDAIYITYSGLRAPRKSGENSVA